MKKLFLILLFPLFLFSQATVINETFSDFTFTVNANIKGYWIFDDYYHDNASNGDTLQNDLSGNDNDLTPTEFSTDFASELTGSNPAYENGNALVFDGVDQFLSRPDDADFDFGVGEDFTIEGWIYVSDNTTGRIISKRQGGVGWEIYMSTKNINIFVGDGIAPSYGNVANNLTENQWYHFAVTVEHGVEAIGYLDGVEQITKDISATAASLENSIQLAVGTISGDSIFFNGEIAEVRISDTLRSTQDIKESYGLAKGWTSYAGGVTRDAALGFYFGLSGTVAYPIANTSQTAGYQWQLAWDDSVAGGTWTSRTATFADDFSSDSLVLEISGTDLICKYGASGTYTTIATTGRGDTTFIDNVVLGEVVKDDGGFPKFKRFPNYGGFK